MGEQVDLTAVERWITSGGEVRLGAVRSGQVEALLCRCDGGEVVDRLWYDDAARPALERLAAAD